MKMFTCSAFVVLTLLAGVSFAAVPTLVDQDLNFVSDLLGTTPDWLRVDTSYVCPPDHGPYTCTRDVDCQRYFGLPSNYVCMGPGGTCNGHCEPC